MIDHIDLPVRDYRTSFDFYLAALAPLGYAPGWQPAPTAGCLLAPTPAGPAPVLWLHQDEQARGDLHLAFLAPDRRTVDAFHAAAVSAGGEDNGAPKERPEYHPDYYAAYVLDPDGANIEAVCHHA
jgi:catechol 2,3-dioxygenase-like lactoylglutathione lyase family enzyme